MAERSIESVSALMDGEVADFELRRVLERMDQEPELQDTWQRYHTLRSVMQKEELADPSLDISGAVFAAIESEPTYSASTDDSAAKQPVAKEKSSFWKPLTSMAVAASVTAVVILGAQNTIEPQSQQLVDNRPGYTLPSTTAISNDFVRAQFGNRSLMTEPWQEPEIIRASEGLDRYIKQHKHMLSGQPSEWKAAWLPEGYEGLKRDVMAHAEVHAFSNGSSSFTVSIERFGMQAVPEGVAETKGMVAVGKRVGDQFVTVVGDVPLMIAERVASSVVRR